MAGRTPHQAREAFLAPLRRVLSCLTDAQFVYQSEPEGEAEALTTSQAPLRLPRGFRDALALTVRQRYALVETGDPERGPWKVSTLGYWYRIDDVDGAELAAWHWHPWARSRERRPHAHVAGPMADLHLPTGRVGMESVARLLLTELDVVPRRGDRREVIEEAEEAFGRWSTWA